MFNAHCAGCITKQDCFDFAECLREKFNFVLEDNAGETTELTEEALLEHRVLTADVPIFREASDT